MKRIFTEKLIFFLKWSLDFLHACGTKLMYATDKDIKYAVNHVIDEERSRTADADVLLRLCQDLALLGLVLQSARRDVCRTLGRCLLSRKPETTSTPVRRRDTWLSRSVLSDSVTPWTAARQAPLSMEFSRQEY